MKNYIKNIPQALYLGFEIQLFEIGEIESALNDFFNENAHKLPQVEAECEVINNGRTQYASYGDWSCDGQIVDFSENWSKSPDTKVFHSSFVFEDKDGLIKCMNLYYLVGETEYNAPEGYAYVNGKHVKTEEDAV